MTDEELAVIGVRTLELDHFTLSATGLTVKGDPTFAEWQALGQTLETLERGVAWIVGDWVNIGEARYDQMASQVIDHENWRPETVRVYAWTAEKVPKENRRADLPFDHHQIVAALPPEEQRTWLARAAEGDDGVRWSSGRLKQEVRAVSGVAHVEYLLLIAFDQPADRDIVATEHERVGRKVRRFEHTKKAKAPEL